jgi:hypothetical protein
MRITLGEAREQLYQSIVPSIDNQLNIDKFNFYLNLAQERLINSGKWNGTILPIRFLSPDGIITLPRNFISILASKWVKDQASGPIQIHNNWFSYLNATTDLWASSHWPRYGYNNTFINDIGDGFCTFKNSPYTSCTLKIEAESSFDSGNSVVIRGKDINDNIVTITHELSFPNSITTQVFNGTITMFQKPITFGRINIYAVNGINETLIGSYEASETTASYHRYSVPNEPSVDYIDALCKIRYVPCITDTDEVIVSNLGALKNMLTSLKFEDEADLERSEMFFNKALQLLNGENKETRGGSKWTLNIDPATMQFNNLWQGR